MLEKEVVDLSKHRQLRAKNLLNQSEILLQNQMYDGSINRSYYAIFNAIRSILSLVKLDSSKHSGVLSLFDQYFVKTGIFDKRYSRIAHSAFDTRQSYDYEDFSVPSETEATAQINDARIFLTEVELKREKLIKGEIDLPNVP